MAVMLRTKLGAPLSRSTQAPNSYMVCLIKGTFGEEGVVGGNVIDTRL